MLLVFAFSDSKKKQYKEAASSSNTPSHAKDKARAKIKTVRLVCPQYTSLAACPSGRRAGWSVRRFDLLVLSEAPDVVLCLSAQGEGALLRISSQCYKPTSPPLRGIVVPPPSGKSSGIQKNRK
jgi:hypothetical protein